MANPEMKIRRPGGSESNKALVELLTSAMGRDAVKLMKDLGAAGPRAQVAEIVYHDGKIMLPQGMSIPDAIELLEARQEFMSTKVVVQEDFNVLPYDGAAALGAVLTKRFGWAHGVETPGFFGIQSPSMIRVPVGVDEYAEVPWGRFKIPQVDGHIQCDARKNSEGCWQFFMYAETLRKDEASVREIFELVRQHLKTDSLYRGKALRIKFRDADGDALPQPEVQFFDTSAYSREMLIYSDDVAAAIESNLFTPIERVQDVIENAIPVKRTVMLSGTYGTGKTLAASVAAALAQKAGVTYVYCASADELTDVLTFARQYQSPAAVVFCEDIDRELDEERDADMDEILNLIDGIDTKSHNIITVLTSNNVRAITAAMLRPGRLDCVIDVTTPDAKATERLLRVVGNGAILPETDLSEVAAVLAGNIPAVITEVVKRAKLVQLGKQPRGTPLEYLSAAALLEAAKGMSHQLELLQERIDAEAEPEGNTLEEALAGVVNRVLDERG